MAKVAAAQTPNLIFGRIIDAQNRALANLIVYAYDRDMRSEELLGETITDRDGKYEIQWEGNKLDTLGKGTADIAIKVYTRERKVLLYASDMDNIRFNAGAKEEINVIIRQAIPAETVEYDFILKEVTALKDKVAVKDLQENEQFRDITFISKEAEIAFDKIEHLVVAHRLQAVSDIEPAFFYALLRKNTLLKNDLSNTIGVRLRIGLETDILPLFDDITLTDPKIIERDVLAAIKEMIVSENVSKQITLAKVVLTKIDISANTESLIKDPIFKVALENELKAKIIETLAAKNNEALKQDIKALDINVSENKDKSLADVIKTLSSKLSATYKEVFDAFLKSNNKKANTPVKDLLGFDKKATDNPVFSAPLIKYNTEKLGTIIKANTLKIDVEKELPVFVAASSDVKAQLISQWKHEKKWSAAQTKSVENAAKLMRVANNQVDFVAAIWNEGIQDTAALVKYNKDTLLQVMQKNKISSSDPAANTAFVEKILAKVERTHPSPHFLYRVLEKPEWLGLDAADRPKPSAAFKSFYAKNKDFDLATEPVIALETGLLNPKIQGISNATSKLVKELSHAQQALRLSSSTDMAALLFKNGITTQKAVTTSHSTLMREVGLNAAEAIEIKEKAQYYHEVAMNGFFAYRDLISNPFLKTPLNNFTPVTGEILQGIGKTNNWTTIQTLNGLNDFDSIEDLFGSQNYCECEHCQSVLSPAAYFVDLMRFTEKRVLQHKVDYTDVQILDETHPIHLKTRRPDLWKLKLTCENTNKRIPYIEIVNEVLTAFIEKQLGTAKSVTTRLLEETPDTEFLLPYNEPLDEVRTWLSYFGIQRIDILDYLYPTPTAAESKILAMERLNLSKEMYGIIIKTALPAVVDNDVLAFRRKSGINAEETEQLTKMKFWQGQLSIKQVQDTSDIQKFTLEFSSTLPNWQGQWHRLIRLWKASSWSIPELDTIFEAFGITKDNLNATAILNLAAFKQVQTLLKSDAEVTAGILNGLRERKTAYSKLSWEQLLPMGWIPNETVFLPALTAIADEGAANLILRLQGIYGVNSSDILACVSLLQFKIGRVVAGSIQLTFNTFALNTIFRYIQLYKWSKVGSFEVFQQLLTVWGNGNIRYLDTPLQDIPEFVKFLQSFQTLGISIDDLVYMFDPTINANVLSDEDKKTLESDDMRKFIASADFTTGDKYSNFFNKWLAIDKEVVAYYRNFIEQSKQALVTYFSDIITKTPDNSTYIALSNIKKRIERLDFLKAKYKIDLANIKAIAQAAQNYTYPKLGFSTWQDKNWVKEIAYLGAWLSETKALKNFDLHTILRGIEKETVFSETTQKGIAKWQNIDLAQVVSSLEPTDSLTVIHTVWERIAWAKKLNINTNLLNNFKTDNSIVSLTNQSLLLQNTIRSKFIDIESWEAKTQDFKNKLSSNKRDALCNFVMFNSSIRAKGFDFEDREDLYNYFLLDVGMGDCFTLPRIVVATNSLQVYIDRCIMSMERSKDETINVSLDIDEMEEWSWRKNYRVWEANRKIFLFPENYIEPEIRDNKSPEFKELEDELLQQKLNAEVVENAYKKYLQQIMTLAELRIAGAYHDAAYNRVYLFGKTNKQPIEYYYRHAEFLKNGGIIWSNWEKMNIAISAEDVSAIRHNGKLHVFWTSYLRKDISKVDQGTQKIKMHTYDVFANYSYLKVDKKWSVPQKIELNYRVNSPIEPFLRLAMYKDIPNINEEASTSANPDVTVVRENVLKEFERRVFRKPYPVIASKQTHLKLDYIWTDKYNPAQSIYLESNAKIDGFTVIVQIKVPFMADLVSIPFEIGDFSTNVNTASVQTPNPPIFINFLTAPYMTYTKPFSLFNNGNVVTFTLELYLYQDNNTNQYKYSLKTTSTGDPGINFKNIYSEIKSGELIIDHKMTDIISSSSIEYEENTINMPEQKNIGTIEYNDTTVPDSFKREYMSYFDGFKDFFVTDGTEYFAIGDNIGDNDYKIQKPFEVALLITPTTKKYNLNPENLQTLWDKISVGIDTLLETQTQQIVVSQMDYSQSFGNYFYELFFHIPMRFAGHLNAAGKYREARHWYSYIYNPMAIKDKLEQLLYPYDVNWRFAAFRNLGIKKLREIYSDPNAIEVYQRNPGNPHAIARQRIGAYQKNVVMKYLDNLMDWGDYLFQQYTPESTSEARQLYSIVKMILGNKPETVGKCQEEKAFTYDDIKDKGVTDFIYSLFTSGPVYPDSNDKFELTSDVFNMDATVVTQLGNSSVLDSKLKKSTELKTQTFATKEANKDWSIMEVANTSNANFAGDKMQARPRIPITYFQLESDLFFCFPHNKDFIKYWDRVVDRIFKLNHCMDINGVKKEMPAFAPEIDPALLASMVAEGLSFEDIAAAVNSPLPNHRFSYLIEKAKQFCGTVQSFGGALFAAIEKQDAEQLTQIRASHEQNILNLTTQNKKRQIEQAKANYQNLLENKKNIENRKTHYQGLIDEGLIAWERAEQVAKWTSGTIRTVEGIWQFLGGGLHLIPQVGSPFSMKYGGDELGKSSNSIANAMESIAKIADNVAILAGLEASHIRRDEEWQFQAATATQDLKAMEQQLKASEIAIAMAEYDLELHNTTIEQSKELYEFYTTKFSNYTHYTFQIKQLQTLYRMAFNLANDLAKQAQAAFNFERFSTTPNPVFIKADNWNPGKFGLLAGEHLMLQLMQLEKEFIETDKRKIEITQHFSMLQIAPAKLLELKMEGKCVGFSIPEAAFDLVYPGYFRRMIKSVRISMPCIAGPYTNIGATLTLIKGELKAKADTAALIDFTKCATTTIATSTAQNDGGQFELNFRDERYLPFEGAGAVSSWTLSLPKTVRPFDYNTISDVIFHISYTADYDGAFKDTTESRLKADLNDFDGKKLTRVFSLRHDFPNEWHKLTLATNSTDTILNLKKEHFPYFANINSIKSTESDAFVLDKDDKLEKKTNALIIKSGDMEVTIPKALGENNNKDVLFIVKYELRV